MTDYSSTERQSVDSQTYDCLPIKRETVRRQSQGYLGFYGLFFLQSLMGS